MKPIKAEDGRIRFAAENQADLVIAEEAENLWNSFNNPGTKVHYSQAVITEPRPFSFAQADRVSGGLNMIYENRLELQNFGWQEAGSWLVKLNKLSEPDFQATLFDFVRAHTDREKGHLPFDKTEESWKTGADTAEDLPVVVDLKQAETAGEQKVIRLNRDKSLARA